MTISRASVATERPARYGKQLTSHMGRRCEVTWDDESGTGTIVLPGEKARTGLRAIPGVLELVLESDPEVTDRFEEVVGIHLARFGARDALVVAWTRDEGGQGTTQGPVDPAELRQGRGE